MQDKARVKRLRREQQNLLSAKAILSGASVTAYEVKEITCPDRVRFKSFATLPEIQALMQQGVAELPYYKYALLMATHCLADGDTLPCNVV